MLVCRDFKANKSKAWLKHALTFCRSASLRHSSPRHWLKSSLPRRDWPGKSLERRESSECRKPRGPSRPERNLRRTIGSSGWALAGRFAAGSRTGTGWTGASRTRSRSWGWTRPRSCCPGNPGCQESSGGRGKLRGSSTGLATLKKRSSCLVVMNKKLKLKKKLDTLIGKKSCLT